MKKTSVYLTDEDAAALRQLARATGRSQADLIREGVGRMLRPAPEKAFHSIGKGAGDGSGVRRWDADELAERRLVQG
jgi:Arc/MetJ-type ribon-helix-helix transcriptional regulator